MIYKQHKDSDTKTSLLGLGCMRFPVLHGNTIDFDAAEEIIDYAYEHGINYYDSAYVYNNGDSERTIGKALKKYPRESFMLATKLPGWKCTDKQAVLDTFQEQLDRCQVDYFDFYLCHDVNERSIGVYLQDFLIPTLEDFKRQGKIRKLGFSSHGNPETLKRFASIREWDFAQIQLNYLDWDYQDAKQQYEILTELGIPVIVMEPVRGGRLASLCPEADALFKEYAPDKSIASWALRFAAGHENIQVVLSGMSTMEQIIDNVVTISEFEPLSGKELEIIGKAVQMLKEKTLIPCTACRYCCEECPVQLNIPELLDGFNAYKLAPHPMSLTPILGLPEEEKPGSCIACGQCMNRCPQNIAIPDLLAELDDILQKAPPPPR